MLTVTQNRTSKYDSKCVLTVNKFLWLLHCGRILIICGGHINYILFHHSAALSYVVTEFLLKKTSHNNGGSMGLLLYFCGEITIIVHHCRGKLRWCFMT